MGYSRLEKYRPMIAAEWRKKSDADLNHKVTCGIRFSIESQVFDEKEIARDVLASRRAAASKPRAEEPKSDPPSKKQPTEAEMKKMESYALEVLSDPDATPENKELAKKYLNARGVKFDENAPSDAAIARAMSTGTRLAPSAQSLIERCMPLDSTAATIERQKRVLRGGN